MDFSNTRLAVASTLLLLAACEGVIGDPETSITPPPAPGEALRCADPPPVRAVDVPMRRITPTQYANAIRDVFDGHLDPSPMFPDQTGDSVTGYTTEPVLNSVDELAAEQLMLAAEDVALQVPDALSALLDCGGDACVDDYLDAYGRRAFRRPLHAEERAVFQRIYDDARADEASVEDALAMVTAVLLQSPQFLYLPEIGTGDAEVRELTGYELATRLSFLFWDSVPDDALLDAAASGALDDADGVAIEARRLLDHPNAARMTRRFFREWVHVDELAADDRDPEVHPWFGDVAPSIGESFDRYVRASLEEGWTLPELLTSPRVAVDSELAALYGVDEPTEAWGWAELDPERGVGLMTQPAVLASHAHYGESSYVLRGRFIVGGLLCRTLGVPPADAIDRAAEIRGSLPEDATSREESHAIRSTHPCGGCHDSLDPPGLAFEHFDATGRWRDTDLHGNEIDTAGVLEGTRPIAFDGPADLMAQLAESDEVVECFDTQLFRYFAGREEAHGDGCALEEIGDARSATDGSLSEFLVSFTTTDAFRHRRLTAEGEDR